MEQYVGQYASMSNKQLRNLCKSRGYKRYSTFNKQKLCNLLINKSHVVSKEDIPYNVIGMGPDGRGIKPDMLYTMSKYGKYITNEIEVDGGYKVRGVNLEGRFDAYWIPDETYYYTGYRDVYTDDESDEPDAYLASDTTPGGWFVPTSQYADYKAHLTSLEAKSWPSPKSLQFLAGHVINSKTTKFWKDWIKANNYTVPQSILNYAKTCK